MVSGSYCRLQDHPSPWRQGYKTDQQPWLLRGAGLCDHCSPCLSVWATRLNYSSELQMARKLGTCETQVLRCSSCWLVAAGSLYLLSCVQGVLSAAA